MKITIFCKRDLALAKIREFASLQEAARNGYLSGYFSAGDINRTVANAPCVVVEQIEETHTDDNGREYLGLTLLKHEIKSGRVVISGRSVIYFKN